MDVEPKIYEEELDDLSPLECDEQKCDSVKCVKKEKWLKILAPNKLLTIPPILLAHKE